MIPPKKRASMEIINMKYYQLMIFFVGSRALNRLGKYSVRELHLQFS
jgi:hypothetical protein